jgi:hypothetical protein
MANLPKLPGIPSISPVQDTTIAAILRPMKESLEILGGAISGNPLPNGTVVDAGLNPAISNTTINTTNVYDGATDTTPPPTPGGLSISAGFTNILLSWTDPNVSGAFLNYAYTEVWRSVDNVLAHAVLQGFAPGAVYSDPVGTNKSYYYWIRFVSQANIAGPYNSSTGTLGGTGLVGGVDLSDLIIDATKLAANAVESGKIKDYAITTTKIANLAVGNAAIANLAVSNAKIQDLAVDDAKISSLAVNKLTAGSVSVGQYIQSTGYSAGTTGWKIDGNGFAEFSAASIRGLLTASQIDTRGLSIKDMSGNVILAAGTALNYSYVNPDPGWLNSALTPSITNAQNTANSKVSKSGDTVTGRITFSITDGMFAGSDLNNGVYFGKDGIVAKKAGSVTFAIDNAGNATIGGNVTTGTIGGSNISPTYIRSSNYSAGSAGWTIDSSGNVEFNAISVRSGQITGALLTAYQVNSYSGLYVKVSGGTPISTTNGPYYLNGNTGTPLYLVYSGTMPAPATAPHKIAAVVNVQATTGGASKDLGVLILTNYNISGDYLTAQEQISYMTNSGSYGIATNSSGVTSGTYASATPVGIFVTGYNADYTIQAINGLAWGVR